MKLGDKYFMRMLLNYMLFSAKTIDANNDEISNYMKKLNGMLLGMFICVVGLFLGFLYLVLR